MQPDVLGFVFATGVFAALGALFGLVSRVVAGDVSELSYTIVPGIARGLAEW
jgi:hypothetical protein